MSKPAPQIPVSFTDLEALGFKFKTEELPKKLANGEICTSVKLTEVSYNNSLVDRNFMYAWLKELGVDPTKKIYVREKTTHRPLLTNKPSFNYCFIGFERLDSDWVKSGRASDEAIMATSRMKDMTAVVGRLSHGGERDE